MPDNNTPTAASLRLTQRVSIFLVNQLWLVWIVVLVLLLGDIVTTLKDGETPWLAVLGVMTLFTVIKLSAPMFARPRGWVIKGVGFLTALGRRRISEEDGSE
jgi:hypothetical protein